METGEKLVQILERERFSLNMHSYRRFYGRPKKGLDGFHGVRSLDIPKTCMALFGVWFGLLGWGHEDWIDGPYGEYGLLI